MFCGGSKILKGKWFFVSIVFKFGIGVLEFLFLRYVMDLENEVIIGIVTN